MTIAQLGTDQAFQGLRRRSLVDEIIESFKTEIITGRLRPGDRVPPEIELASRFQVSRGAVREAMKTLQSIGAVTIRRGDGTYIVKRPGESLLNPLVFAVLLEAASPTDLVELRELLEVGYCQLASARMDAEDWSAIEAAQERFEACVTAGDGDVEKVTLLDLQFHYSLLDATHNPLVKKIGRAVEELYHNTIKTTHQTDRGQGTGVVGHRQIMKAIRSGDPDHIRQTVRESLSYWAHETEREDAETALSVRAGSR